MTTRRIALMGASGAGKSTAATLLMELGAEAGITCRRLRLAEPLYMLQELIYRTCGSPLENPATQDGLLLADLASNIRRISPDFLVADLRRRLEQIDEATAETVVCEDMRAPDVEGMAALGFLPVKIVAPSDVRLARRAARRDIASPNDSHPLEADRDVHSIVIRNDGTLDDLRSALRPLIQPTMYVERGEVLDA